MIIKFCSDIYTRIEILVRTEGVNTAVSVYRADSVYEKEEQQTGERLFCRLLFPLKRNTVYCCSVPEEGFAFAYLSDCDNMIENGIRFIDRTGHLFDRKNLADRYNVPYREQYHFTPFAGWMNDPNGLCFFNSYYHFFYQANPFGQCWGNMYWGHATSRDLVHWVHLPYVLEPQDEIARDRHLKGGAFSGCAVPLKDKVEFFLTRHIGPAEDGEETIESQTKMSSTDCLQFSKETTLLYRHPPYAGYDFRDPKVNYIDGQWCMVLGSRYNNIPSILLYVSDDRTTWSLDGVLLSEPQNGVRTIECPDFYQVDGTYVATAALMCLKDSCGRMQLTRWYTGDFDGHRMVIRQQGLYDFGTNFYAVQTFENEGRRIAIGWLADVYKEHVTVRDGVNGSSSIPRELHVKNGCLYQVPVREIYQLEGNLLYSGSDNEVVCRLPGSTAHIQLAVSADSDFILYLCSESSRSIAFSYRNSVASIVTEGTESDAVQFVSGIKQLHNAEIFIDRRVVEVFLNDGESVGTKLFYHHQIDSTFHASFTGKSSTHTLSIKTMRSAWQMESITGGLDYGKLQN